ncbi:PIG-L deacetylase family protein [Williamsia maris]|uniref:N-acetylglucosaminyl deacetylase, LmbE family n=1 Tax=Williamsia maris TaxID=72806 RepID=A0ABT1HGG9_9NOCA|nr:PIG-L deacetylase family protein [Williamsia maris]MCP2176085.1 N-acetylglucosaminyl deacetylase, LmbE family [Williamsia maris]
MSQDGPPRPAWTSADPGAAPAGQWREWLDSVELPSALDGDSEQVLVVSAHPDDEVLGAGGFLHDAVAQGIGVTVLCLSDGAASHPGSPTVTPEALAGIRRAELTTALSALGVNRTIHHELPDGGLDRHGDAIAEAIDTAVAAYGGHSLIVSVWRADRHPDHEAVGHAASAVASRLGIALLEYPVWMWHWARPGDEAVPWARARRHRLSPAAVEAKKRAVHAFVSQITDLSDDPADRAVLEPHVLDRLTGPTETFFS